LEPVLDFNSGYVLRALPSLPRQGSKTPWRLHQNYVKDLSMMRFGRVEDGTMEFKAAPVAQRTETATGPNAQTQSEAQAGALGHG